MSGTTNIPAVALLMRKDSKILFVRRSNTGFEDGKWCTPAGHVEAGESFKQAAVREAMEEVGVMIDESDLQFAHMQHTLRQADNVRIHTFFVVERWQGEPFNAEPERHSEVAWFPEDDLPYGEMVDFYPAALHGWLAGQGYDEWRAGQKPE